MLFFIRTLFKNVRLKNIIVPKIQEHDFKKKTLTEQRQITFVLDTAQNYRNRLFLVQSSSVQKPPIVFVHAQFCFKPFLFFIFSYLADIMLTNGI